MRKIAVSLLLAVIVVAGIIGIVLDVTPSYAFSPPSQGSDNATDVIIWYGDNMTLNADISGNVTIPGVTDLVSAVEQASEDIIDELQIINVSIIILALVLFIAILAFWHRDRIMYIVAGLLFVVVGFGFSTTIISDETLLSISLVITGMAIFLKAFAGGKKEEK
jgi:hypothetical protein